MQIVVSKADRNRISDESDIGELNLHRLSSPKRNVDTQRAKRFCGGRNLPELDVGANSVRPCSEIMQFQHCRGWRPRQPARRSEVCIFFTSHAGGQRLSRGRDVEGAVPYKCVVWLFGVVVKKHKW